MELQNNKFCLITLGCRVNVLESEKIINTLVDAGMEFVPDNSKEADIFVVNTCCVTNKAESKSRNDINTAIRLANKLVIVCGCYSQITDLKSLNEKVGIIIGSKYKFSLPELIKKYNGERIIKVDDLSKEDTFENYEDFHFVQHTRAFLKIQDGCNYNCSYCVIPLARGKQRSMKFENAIKIINNYIAKGFKEVVLTGVNTAGYNDNGQSFYDLLNTINKIEGDFRIRISSLEPFQITDEIIDLLTKNKQRWVQSFHLCLQSADDKILNEMNRKYSCDFFKELIQKFRAKSNYCSITTDYIVGFPTETREQFEQSLIKLDELNFSDMHIFPFSLKKGTVAERFKNLVADSEKTKRFDTILKNATKNKVIYLNKFIGQNVRVLFEKSTHKGIQRGHSEYFFDVYVNTDEIYTNTFKFVKIIKIEDAMVYGEIVID